MIYQNLDYKCQIYVIKTKSYLGSGNSCNRSNKIVSKNYYLQISKLLVISFAINNDVNLKVQSCKLYYNKYMIASKQITNTKILAFITFVVFSF